MVPQVLDNKHVKWSAEGQPLEAVLTEGLRHPGIMQTIAHCVTRGPDLYDSACGGETWLLLEYCDGGCLQACHTDVNSVISPLLAGPMPTVRLS